MKATVTLPSSTYFGTTIEVLESTEDSVRLLCPRTARGLTFSKSSVEPFPSAPNDAEEETLP